MFRKSLQNFLRLGEAYEKIIHKTNVVKLLYAGFETCFGWEPQHLRAGILNAQDECPIMNQHPARVEQRPLVHDRALVLGVWITKHISNPDVAGHFEL